MGLGGITVINGNMKSKFCLKCQDFLEKTHVDSSAFRQGNMAKNHKNFFLVSGLTHITVQNQARISVKLQDFLKLKTSL